MSQDLGWGRRLLMCPPQHFDVSYAINPWMDLAVAVDRDLAREQWDALRDALQAAGAEIELLDAQPGLPDLVFTANLGIVDGETFVPARMRHRERRDETAHAIRWFAEQGFQIESLSGDVTQEGAGDALPFGDALVAGHRGRSSQNAYADLARLVDATITTVELADPRFYHVDIVFSPLDARTAIYAPTALTAEGVTTIERLVPDAIALTAGGGRSLLRELRHRRAHGRHGGLHAAPAPRAAGARLHPAGRRRVGVPQGRWRTALPDARARRPPRRARSPSASPRTTTTRWR